jgi:hypothetical protein
MHKIIIKDGEFTINDFINEKDTNEKIGALALTARKLMNTAYETLETKYDDELQKQALNGDKEATIKLFEKIHKKIDDAIFNKIIKIGDPTTTKITTINKDLYLDFESGELIDYSGSFTEICAVVLLKLMEEVTKSGGSFKETFEYLKYADEMLQDSKKLETTRENIKKFEKLNGLIKIATIGTEQNASIKIKNESSFFSAIILEGLKSIVYNDDAELFGQFFKTAAGENEIKIKVYVKYGEMTFEISKGSKVKRADIVKLLRNCKKMLEEEVWEDTKKLSGTCTEKFKKVTKELIEKEGTNFYNAIKYRETAKWIAENGDF